VIVPKESNKLKRTDGSLIPSRSNLYATRDDGSLVVGNTHAGPCIVVSESSREEALRMLRPGCTATADSADQTVEAPVEAGFLVSSEIDEYQRL
jgi:hypothetical protein